MAEQGEPNKWYCDTCHGEVRGPSTGMLTWKLDTAGRLCKFQVVHREACPSDHSGYMELDLLVGSDGVARLLSMLSAGSVRARVGARGFNVVASLDEFVDVFRRLQTPHYEDARLHFGDSRLLADDFSGCGPGGGELLYLSSNLREIPGRYRKPGARSVLQTVLELFRRWRVEAAPVIASKGRSC